MEPSSTRAAATTEASAEARRALAARTLRIVVWAAGAAAFGHLAASLDAAAVGAALAAGPASLLAFASACSNSSRR